MTVNAGGISEYSHSLHAFFMGLAEHAPRGRDHLLNNCRCTRADKMPWLDQELRCSAVPASWHCERIDDGIRAEARTAILVADRNLSGKPKFERQNSQQITNALSSLSYCRMFQGTDLFCNWVRRLTNPDVHRGRAGVVL
jgi:hypothetical protein